MLETARGCTVYSFFSFSVCLSVCISFFFFLSFFASLCLSVWSVHVGVDLPRDEQIVKDLQVSLSVLLLLLSITFFLLL